jgi:hypothetical protein
MPKYMLLNLPHDLIYWSRSAVKIFNSMLTNSIPLCPKRATKIVQMRRDIEHSPYKYLSNTPGGV